MIDMIAGEAARLIEDEFAKGHIGGTTQRLASIQVIVIDAIRQAFDEATRGITAAALTSTLRDGQP